MVGKCWNDIPAHFPFVELDEFVVMPNHLHGILWIVDAAGPNVGAGANENVVGANMDVVRANMDVVRAKDLSPLRQRPPQPYGTSKTIGSIVRGFKIGVTKWMRQENITYDVWQRNYYEHIIRNENDMDRIRQYIINNPLSWQTDDLFTSLT